MPPAKSFAAAPFHTEATEQSDCAKDRGRGTNRIMGPTMQISVDKISTSPGQQDQSATEPDTHNVEYRTEE